MAIPKECKRLAEVDFPIAEVSRSSISDKYIRYKPTTTLHTWWAQRPLAACRAMLLALLLPDPCDIHCPPGFRENARVALSEVYGQPGPSDEDLRDTLLAFIRDSADMDTATMANFKRVNHVLLSSLYGNEMPLVVDTFAGAGSIPLEGLRLGCDVVSSDLNPVAVFIENLILNDIPRQREDLLEQFSSTARTVQHAVFHKLEPFYPTPDSTSRPIAYMWARTVQCESPACGAEIPLVRSMWLSKKRNQKRALRTRVLRTPGHTPMVEFEIFRPQYDKEVQSGNISRARAICFCCGTTLHPDRVRMQLIEQRGGADSKFDESGRRIGGALLIAIVTFDERLRQRGYRLPVDKDYASVLMAQQELARLNAELLPFGLSRVPDETLPLMSGTFNVPIYGITTWGDMFTARQKLSLVTLCDAVRQIHEDTPQHAVAKLLACAVNRFARHCNGNARWNNVIESVEPAFGTQALPITWTFPESVPWGHWAENFDGAIDAIEQTLLVGFKGIQKPAQVEIADAKASPLPDSSCQVWFTDPPYYYAVPYADLSDFFYVWLRRMLPKYQLLSHSYESNNQLTPKQAELCEMAHWDPVRYGHKDKEFFENGMGLAFSEGRRILAENGIGCIVFAHKTTEGWEALLGGIVKGGWVVTASWPISTERTGRLRARESAALSASIHIVCRPRPSDATVGDWSRIYSELPRHVDSWMNRLESEGVRGADLVFACIGPALELYSQYRQVVDVQDRPIPLGGDPTATEPYKRGYLAYVWETVARLALQLVLGNPESRDSHGVSDALEEDSRLTALFLWTQRATGSEDPLAGEDEVAGDDDLEEEGDDEEGTSAKKKKGLSLPYDVVRRFAQPLGIHLSTWEKRILATEKGVVRLLPVAERSRQLFGEDGADSIASELEQGPVAARNLQLTLFAEETPPATGRKRGGKGGTADGELNTRREATTLDRVHAAMLLQKAGRPQALRSLLTAEQERGPCSCA